jgi:hypothetical protein
MVCEETKDGVRVGGHRQLLKARRTWKELGLHSECDRRPLVDLEESDSQEITPSEMGMEGRQHESLGSWKAKGRTVIGMADQRMSSLRQQEAA